MKATDRAILIGFLAVGLLAAFYMMVLSPKREEATKVKDDVALLESQISEQEQLASYAEQARQEFPKYYGRMVVLGKAVPEDSDTASLLVQLDSIARRTGTEFNGLALAQGASGASETPPAPAPAAPAPAEGTESSATPTSTSSAGATPAPATETAAANLPIGATVGSAGLPTLPYDLNFTGTFFEMADFIGGLDQMIQLREQAGQVSVEGRLATVDGFALIGGTPGSSPVLDASFLLTTYMTPAEQGLTLGATPEGPAPAAPGQPQLTQTGSTTP